MSDPRKQPKWDLDLESAFLPSWAQKPARKNLYSKYEGEEGISARRKDSRHPDRQHKRHSKPKERRNQDSPKNDSRRPAPSTQNRHPNRETNNSRQTHRPSKHAGQEPNKVKLKHLSQQEILASLPNLKLSILPDPDRVKSLARQIRLQGRAYALFDIAHLVLKYPDRFEISASISPDGKGKPVSEQWLCRLDETLWLSRDEAVGYALDRHFDRFYERVKTKTEPPKGHFTFVAQCGISGKILGPPNHHGYQETLRKLHAEQFSRMNLQAYKDQVKIVHDEETVKKWLDDQSWKTEYQTKTAEPAVLGSWDEVTAHFKTHHLKKTLKTGKTLRLSAAAGLQTPSKAVRELIRFRIAEQRKFPLQTATTLGQMFARQGLQIFKINRSILHVSVARPRYLDINETPVSEGVKHIVDCINTTPDCTRKKLIKALRPPTKPSPPPTAETEPPPAIPATNQPTPEERAIITDLHWLIHEGHVIEFSNGKMETAKKPLPHPEKKPGKRHPTPSHSQSVPA